MGDLDLYQRNDALPHSYTLKRDEPRYFPGVPPENSFDVGAPLCRYENSNRG